MNDIGKLKILLGELAVDSGRKGETSQQWMDRLIHLREYLDKKILEQAKELGNQSVA